MNTDIGALVNKYRNRHRRCKTCIHASDYRIIWCCNAKRSRHIGDLCDTRIAGAFCKLYSPAPFNERM